MRYLRVLGGLGVALGLILLAFSLIPTVVPAQSTVAGGLPTATPALCPPTWQIVSSPNEDPTHNSWLDGVTAASPNDIWAFGGSYLSYPDTSLVLHWDGQQWSIVPSPNTIHGSKLLAGAVQGSKLWAVGGQHICCGTNAVTLYNDGTTWSVFTGPGGRPAWWEGIASIGPDDLWAVGYSNWSGNPLGTIIARVTTSTVTVVTSPDPGGLGQLNSVATNGAADAWAVGYNQTNTAKRTLVERWDGTAWAVVPSPNSSSSDNSLAGVAQAGPNNVWAVGHFYDDASMFDRTLVEHWDGTTWSIVPSPNTPTGGYLNSLAVVAPDDIWAVGHDNNEHTLALHWDGTVWSIVSSPNGGTQNVFTAVTALGPHDVWAVGVYTDNNNVTRTLTAHYTDECPAGLGTPTATATPPAPSPTATATTCPPSWQIVTSPNADPLRDSSLAGAAAAGPNDVWAFGSVATTRYPIQESQILHWDGQQWSIVPSANSLYGADLRAGVLQAGQIWTVGGQDNCCSTDAVTLHWDGTAWSVLTGPGGRPAWFEALASIGPNDLWAVGYADRSNNLSGSLIARVTGSTVTEVAHPDPGGYGPLEGVVANGSTDAWAVGYHHNNSPDQTLVERWDGTAWNVVPSPSISGTDNSLIGVAIAGLNDVWGVGRYYDQSSSLEEPLIEHWDGTAWSIAPSPHSPTGGHLKAIAVVAPNDIWAVGDDTTGQTLTLHWDGMVWSIVSSPNAGSENVFSAVTALGPNDVWAVGAYTDSSNIRRTLTAHYTNECPAGLGTPTVTATPPPSNTPTPTPTVCTLGAWSQAAPYPRPASDQALVTYGGLLYSFGGSAYSYSSNAYKYNPLTNNWTAIAPLPTPLYGGRAVTDGTAIYILAGHDGYNNLPNLWRYDPVSDTYTTLAPALSGLVDHSAVYQNGKIYRIGGCFVSHQCHSRDTVEIYDIATDTWTTGAPYPVVASALATMSDGTYIYGAGGWDADGLAIAKTYRYDPATNTWDDAAIADLPTPRAAMAGDRLNGQWLLAGGVDAVGFTGSAVAWDPGSNSWGPLPALGQTIAFVTGVTVGQTFYVIGNFDSNYVSHPDVQRYGLVPCSTVTATPTPALCLNAKGDQVLCTTTPTRTNTATRTPTPTHTVAASPSPTDCPVYFVDVPPDNGFYSYIRCLACRGIVGGYPCGGPGEPCPGQYYRPNNNVTRGQVSKIVAQSAGFNDVIPSSQQTFQDVAPGSTFHVYVERLSSRGIIGGYPCGGAGEPCVAPTNRPYFRANNNVTRGQLAKITSGAALWTETPTGQTFQDVAPGSTFYLYIERMSSRAIIGGYPCGGVGEPCVAPANRPYYRPNNNATRGQMSKIAASAFFPNCYTPGPTPTATNTPTRTPTALPTITPNGACTLFPANNIWNRNIAAQPTYARSAAYINSMGNGSPLHPDFGAGLYLGRPIGIPYTTVPGNQPLVPITFDIAGQSDPGPYPIPTNAPIEGGPTSTGDRHVLVIERGSCTLYEMWDSHPNANGSWHAGSGAHWLLGSNALRTDTWTSADAAGLPILSGLANYDEVASGVIRHALRFTVDSTQHAYLWPARHQASSITDLNVPPMGLRLRLKAGVNISGYPPQARVILQALKDYGMFLADNGSSIYLSGTQDDRWDNDDLHTLQQIHGSDFEAIDESALMIDPNSGQSR